MITDDEVMDLFERADPARGDDPAPTIAAAEFLDGLRSHQSYVPESEPTRVDLGPSASRRWRIFTAVAAIGLLIVGALVLAASTEPDGPTTDPTPVTTEPTRNPTNPVAVGVANEFVGAFGAFDAEAAAELLSDDADLSQVSVPGQVDQPAAIRRQDLPLLLALLEAQGYEQTADLCQVISDTEGETVVRCPLSFSSLRSATFAPGPFGPNHIDVIVRRRTIVRVTTRWAAARFEAEVWEPFAAWVSANHPADANVMYPDGSRSSARLTEASIRAWGQRTQEYAALQGAAMVQVAEDLMAARDAHDAGGALAFVADDGVAAQLCNTGLTPRYACVVDDPEEPIMGRVPLDSAEVAFAFEAEALLGLRFDDVDCAKAPGPLVTCSYRMDSRLRRIAGYPPVRAASSIGVVDGQVRLVAFPLLNIGFNPAGFNPAEAEPFVHWLARVHPEVLGEGDLPSTDGPLFQAQGQELILVLTRPSLVRLAGYLVEYEAAGGPAAAEDPSRVHRRVAGLSFSLDAPAPWGPGPIERLADADGLRSRSLYVSQSRVGPQGAEAVVYWTGFPADGGLAEPCDRLLGGVEDPSASELAGLLAAAPGTRVVEPPTEVTVGERPAVHIRLVVLEDRGCDPGYFFSWPETGMGAAWYGTNTGDTIEVWITPGVGRLLVIVGETTPQAGPDLVNDVQQVVHSIRFER